MLIIQICEIINSNRIKYSKLSKYMKLLIVIGLNTLNKTIEVALNIEAS